MIIVRPKGGKGLRSRLFVQRLERKQKVLMQGVQSNSTIALLPNTSSLIGSLHFARCLVLVLLLVTAVLVEILACK